MTTVRSIPERHAPVVRWAVAPSAAAGVLCVAVATVISGRAGLYGATAGAVVLLVFLGFGHSTRRMVSVVEPQLQLVIVLLTYGLQVVALLLVYATFQRSDVGTEQVSSAAVGVTIMVCAVVWSAGRVIAAGKERTLLFDEEVRR